MAYVLAKGNKPYYVSSKGIFPCSIDAFSVVVDFDNPIKKKLPKELNIFTEDELKHRLGIKKVQGWSEALQKVTLVSNRKYSTLEKSAGKAIENVNEVSE